MSGGLYDAAPMPLRWRVVRALATLAAAAVLMLVIAEWTWRWIAPAPKAPRVASEANQSPARTIVAAPWFGASASPKAGATAQTQASAGGLAGDARLLGIITGRDGNGYALFRFADRGPVLVATGQEIAPGVLLEAITGQGIRISDRGEVRNIALRPTASAASTPPKANAASPQLASRVQRTVACTLPPGSSGPVYRLNAELLTGIAAKPDSWSNAFSAGSDGLAMREGNAFGAMLGMKPGDRVTQANGIALRNTEDVLVAVIRPLLASQPVRVVGVHEGRAAEWIFVNASACPS
jgi:hypothetical protein